MWNKVDECQMLSEKRSKALKRLHTVYLRSYDILAKVKLEGQKTALSSPGTGEYSRLILRVAAFLRACHIPLSYSIPPK